MPVAVAATAKPGKKRKKRTKISAIIGERFLSFECEGRAYIGICLGDALEADLQALIAPEYQGFFRGLGQKVTWVIVVRPISLSSLVIYFKLPSPAVWQGKLYDKAEELSSRSEECRTAVLHPRAHCLRGREGDAGLSQGKYPVLYAFSYSCD